MTKPLDPDMKKMIEKLTGTEEERQLCKTLEDTLMLEIAEFMKRHPENGGKLVLSVLVQMTARQIVKKSMDDGIVPADPLQACQVGLQMGVQYFFTEALKNADQTTQEKVVRAIIQEMGDKQ